VGVTGGLAGHDEDAGRGRQEGARIVPDAGAGEGVE
jgi:hypothetical protein